MRSQKKMNAACWDCRFALILNNVRVCCVTGKNEPIGMMPMKCDRYEKEKK